MKANLIFLVGVTSLSGPATIIAADGQEVYSAYCASCHGIDGKARTPAGKKVRAKDLTESKLADGEIEKQIVSGTQDAKGNARMPSFKAKLSPEEIEALISFVKSFRR